MIQLTRLNNHPLAVNSDLIKFIEQAPDTVITLVGSWSFAVRCFRGWFRGGTGR